MILSFAMRTALTVYLLLIVLLFAGCARHPDRHVREVSLTLDDSMDKGSRNETIIFNKEKGAERRVSLMAADGRSTLNRHETGPILTTAFNELVNAIDENDFYNKKDYVRSSFNGADLTLITVVSDEGSHKLIADHRDPQIQHILTAIQKTASEITWMPVDP